MGHLTDPVLWQMRKYLGSLPPEGPLPAGLDLLQRPRCMLGGRRRRLPALGTVPAGCAAVRPIASRSRAARLLAGLWGSLLAGLRFLCQPQSAMQEAARCEGMGLVDFAGAKPEMTALARLVAQALTLLGSSLRCASLWLTPRHLCLQGYLCQSCG